MTRDLYRKLVRRIEAVARALLRLYGGPRGLESAGRKLARRQYSPGQWHRWYQVNRKRQRELSALKRAGFPINPRAVGLPRWAVR